MKTCTARIVVRSPEPATIGGLLLIRVTTRTREMAIRPAIGAGRSRLAQQLLTETVLVTCLGGVFGVLLAGIGLRAMETLGPQDIPRLSEASMNLPVLIFAAALTLTVGLAGRSLSDEDRAVGSLRLTHVC